jgi:hypothetical protein
MDAPAPPLRSTQIILVALALGVVTFTGVVVALRLTSNPDMDPERAKLLLVVLGGLAVSEAVVYVLLRRSFVARAKDSRETSLTLVRHGRIPLPLHTLAIIGGALAEGAGLLGSIAVLLGAPWYALAAPALAVVLILIQLPSQERLSRIVSEA